MRIQHNIMAMSAYRNYTNNVSAMKKNLEKLSSGYKINRAGDDAAGLAISEKMRAQITGLETAQKNAKDGISLVQTAEGALTEVHDMLNRMVQLATQSANGTYDDDVDRLQMQKELNQLRSEIDRIADSSNFNGIKLLNGDMTAPTSTAKITMQGATGLSILSGTSVGTAAGTSTVLHADGKDLALTSFEVDLRNTTVTTSTGAAAAITLTVGGGTVAIAAGSLATGTAYGGASLASMFAAGTTQTSINGVTYNVTLNAAGDGLKFEMDEESAKKITAAASFNVGHTNANAVSLVAGTDQTISIDNVDDLIQNYKVGNMKVDNTLASTETSAAYLTTTNVKDGAGLKIGDTSYVFALSQDTLDKFADVSDPNIKIVDLTEYATNGTLNTADVEKAAAKFSQVASDNSMFRVGVDKDGIISFRERPDYAGDADLGTLDGLKSQLQSFTSLDVEMVAGGGKGKLSLQIGDTADSWNQLEVEIKDCHVAALGIDASAVSIATQADAQQAVDKIKAAINYVSDVRGTLGATQNRLDHTINNLSVMTENIQDAESTIRDTDVAEEMMAYTKNNILIQSAQAMLAQANQVPQGVLQLLQ